MKASVASPAANNSDSGTPAAADKSTYQAAMGSLSVGLVFRPSPEKPESPTSNDFFTLTPRRSQTLRVQIGAPWKDG